MKMAFFVCTHNIVTINDIKPDEYYDGYSETIFIDNIIENEGDLKRLSDNHVRAFGPSHERYLSVLIEGSLMWNRLAEIEGFVELATHMYEAKKCVDEKKVGSTMIYNNCKDNLNDILDANAGLVYDAIIETGFNLKIEIHMNRSANAI